MREQSVSAIRNEVKEDLMNEMEMRKEVSMIHSIKFKMVGIILISIIGSLAMVMISLIPAATEVLTTMTTDYMSDMTLSYGQTIETEVKLLGTDTLQNYDILHMTLESASIKTAPSSYVYLVSKDGTMLYHPTVDKIGKPVENAVIKDVVQRLQKGEKVSSDIAEYDYNGAVKYAAYHIDENAEFVLVISADKDEIMSSITGMTAKMSMIAAVTTVICSIIGFIFAVIIVRPIRRVTKSVRKLADMDFTEDEMQAKMNARKDENGAMSRAITILRNKLAGMAVDIKAQSQTLKNASDDLSNSASETSTTVGQVEKAVFEIADGASSQADETQKATENVMLIGHMVEETTAEVKELHNNANVMKESSEEATKTLDELNEINRKTKESIDVIYEQTNTTNESANKIREATTLIAEIAEETNLLSLNASIEAARAGEQGRGFAVVAAQIQKLAEQSNESARQIEGIIELLITDSEKAVHTMEEVKGIIKEQSEKVVKAGEIFTEVKGRIDASITSVDAIMTTTERLDEARVNVVDVVQNLTAIAEENAANTQETSASVTHVSSIVENISESAGHLREIADKLDDSMSIFKV